MANAAVKDKIAAPIEAVWPSRVGNGKKAHGRDHSGNWPDVGDLAQTLENRWTPAKIEQSHRASRPPELDSLEIPATNRKSRSAHSLPYPAIVAALKT
jgi:hypothetical protein